MADMAAFQASSAPPNTRFLMRVFVAFAVMAAASAGLSLVGKWAGRSIAMAGHTDDRTTREIVIGNDVFVVPANAIRFERARVNGIAQRLDIYLRWPTLEGYTVDSRDAFNHASETPSILFLSIEPRTMSRDMSGRLTPIYSALVEPVGTPGPADTRRYAFTTQSGYESEELVVADRADGGSFVARCLTGPAAEASLAPCQRDVALGDELSLVYRFPAALLAEWRSLDEAVAGWVEARRQTGR